MVTTNTRILVVDDEPNMRSTLADILLDEGYAVATAASGPEALAQCRQTTFDVIIMDLRMPGMTGIETLTRLRQIDHGARVILMSAYAVEEVKRAALGAGALAFVDKPLDLERLLGLVAQAHRAAVLVVSADPRSSQVAEALKGHGFRVTVVGSARAAVDVAQQIAFNVLLLDCELGNTIALQLYHALRQVAPHCETVLLTDAAPGTLDAGLGHLRDLAHLDKRCADWELAALMQRLVGERANAAVD